MRERLRQVWQWGLPVVLLGPALYAGFRAIGPLPPLGPFLHPTTGVWAVAAQREIPEGTVRLPGVADSVLVVFDDRAVPHIFAESAEDAYRTLGYLHARFRLFQLELAARATEGTLTEWFGESALDFDRAQRALGLAWAADRDAAALDSLSQLGRILEAYAGGVNAWIDAMGPGDLPLEFRLIDARPRRWAPRHTYLFVKRMGHTLAYGHPDLLYERLVERVGRDAALALISVNSRIVEPIVPTGAPAPRVERGPLPEPSPPPAMGGAEGESGRRSLVSSPPPGGVGRGWTSEDAARASNNWAVSPARTANGHALLAGDPHLDLSLPSVWFEAHLVVRDQFDVYGVTFPGAPGVPIGFNRDVAWSFTNTGADVLDYYAETLDNAERPTSYRLDGVWRPLAREFAEFRAPSGDLLATDTLYYTHRGPLRRDSAGARSMRWTILDQQIALGAFLDLPYVRSVDEWTATMEFFLAPIQNGVVADRTGQIAVIASGAYPVRPSGRSGLEVFDGEKSTSDWRGFLPVSRYPQARDPAQGFLASANQQPVDPASDSTYFGARWETPWRAMRINELLRADTAVTPDAMRRYQTDPGSARADRFVPALLAAVDAATPALVGGEGLEAARLLSEWDRRYTRDNERAVLFEAAMDALVTATWDELLDPADSTGRRRVMTPGSDLLAALLDDPGSTWWDDRRTAETVESRDAVLIKSLIEGYRDVRERFGDAADGGWRWDQVQTANIYHLLRFPSLSALGLPVQGGRATPTPISGAGTHGPSWRMVVELGPEVRAWGVYPGGQSGNPMSPWYTDRLQRWVDGALDPLPFPHTPDDLPADGVAGRFTLAPARP